ncbi:MULTISPECIES: DUF3299 domain-containing protein [unclassified Variovorax]|uniref:DUF3299 domain-containing protein n=1 Tax=unclassified Variovorax TaxID=663243 RepID=UPI001BD443F5|nr:MULTISPECIES: DUF3299 domain-containing protein [unclassified Variovorax]
MPRRLALALIITTLGAAAWAGDLAPSGTSAANPLGGKAVPAKIAPGQPRLIAWEELVPKDWDPMKAFKGIDFSKLDDNDPRANEMLMKLQKASDNAPTNPAMDGVMVRIPGYLVPLEEKNGQVSEFLLVPYFGACIHTPPPPANQIIHVQTASADKGLRAMDTIWVTGKMQTLRNDSMMGTSGYHVAADSVTRYTGGAK